MVFVWSEGPKAPFVFLWMPEGVLECRVWTALNVGLACYMVQGFSNWKGIIYLGACGHSCIFMHRYDNWWFYSHFVCSHGAGGALQSRTLEVVGRLIDKLGLFIDLYIATWQ